MKLTEAQRAALAAFLVSHFRAFVVEKVGAPFEWIARLFGVAALFGLGVPSGPDFINRWWTTIGPVITTPPGRTSALGEFLRVLCHELAHVTLFWASPVTYLKRYLTRRGRAEIEALCERAACEAWWMLTGTLPVDLGAVDICRHGYALKTEPGEHDDDADLARDLLEQHVTSVRAGVISTDVGMAVREWMLANAADCIVGEVLR